MSDPTGDPTQPGVPPGAMPPAPGQPGGWAPQPSAPPPPPVVPTYGSDASMGGAPTYQSRSVGGTAPMPIASPNAPEKSGGVVGLLLGLLLIVASLVVGAVLLATSASQKEDAVTDMARAPVDCLTELDFSETGTFYFYVETSGDIGEVEGTCSNAEHSYDLDDAPRVALTLTDPDDEQVDLDRTSGISYDVGGFAGESVRTVDIDDDGTYVLLVESREEDAVVAVGRDVSSVGGAAGVAGLLVAVLGTILGLVVVLMSLRRRRKARRAPTAPVQQAWGVAGAPTGWGGSVSPAGATAPVAPPVAAPPVPAQPTAPPVAPPSAPPPPTGGMWEPPAPLT